MIPKFLILHSRTESMTEKFFFVHEKNCIYPLYDSDFIAPIKLNGVFSVYNTMYIPPSVQVHACAMYKLYCV